jgi:hypothetical protein
VGTPPVLQLAALEAALDIWDGVTIEAVRARSIELTEQFVREVEAACPTLVLASPRDPAQRGSQISFRHPEGYAIMQALIARGVIGDFRAPDVLRFGFTPLYTSEADVSGAARVLAGLTSPGLSRPVRHGASSCFADEPSLGRSIVHRHGAGDPAIAARSSGLSALRMSSRLAQTLAATASTPLQIATRRTRRMRTRILFRIGPGKCRNASPPNA